MAALTAAKNVREFDSAFAQLVGNFGSGALVASDIFYPGALVAYDTSDDKIKPAATSTTLIALGRYEGDETVNTAVAGAPTSLRIKSGIFKFENSAAADAIANDDFGKACYIVDDQTVALTNGGATRSVAGKVVHVEADGVWVAVNPLA